MKYTVTSAEASKMLKRIMEEKSMLLAAEKQGRYYNAALGEDEESVRPEYDYEATQKAIAACERKIVAIRHALNAFNLKQTVGDTGMTIDQVLAYMPMLTERKAKLYDMQDRLPKQRATISGVVRTMVIDYVHANYDINKAKADYREAADELRALQTALDAVNSTVTFDMEIPD